MRNIALFNQMLGAYEDSAYTNEYIFGIRYKGNIYMVKTTSQLLALVLKLDKASRGAGYALRFCPNADQKLALLPNSEPLCSAMYFEECVNNSIYNKGEIFEKLVIEKFGQVWEKDNVPFTKAGDIEINGTAYQIKFQKATFCNEKSLANLK